MRFTSLLVVSMLISTCVSAQESISSTLSKLAKATSDSAKIEAYTELFNYYQISSPDSAAYYVNQGLERFTAGNSQRGIAAMNVLGAFIESKRGNMEEARKKHEYALSVYRKINHKRGVATALGGLGILEGKHGNYPKSIKLFLESLEIFESLHDTDGIINTYLRLGVVNEKSNHLDKALDYYERAISILERRDKNSSKLYMLYNNTGIVYGKSRNYDRALTYFEKALQGSRGKPDLTDVYLLTLNNLGIVYDRLDKDEQALKYLNEAEAVAKDKQLLEDYTLIVVSKASVIGKKNPEASLKMLQESLENIKPLNQKSIEADIYDAIIEAYVRLKDYKGAFETLARYKQLEDSLFSINKSKEIMKLQSTHDLEQSKALLAKLKTESASNKLVRNTIICVAVVLCVSLIIMLVLYKRSIRLNEQIKKREEELKRSNDIKDKLFSIIGHDLRGPIGNVPVMLQLLFDETTSPEEQAYMLESLIVHTNASIETLDKLLYWGQAQIKGIGTTQLEFNAKDQLESTLELAATNAKQKRITLSNEIAADVMVLADPSHFDFIVRNLVSNAIKFTHSGGTVTISSDSKSRKGFHVFSVADTGTGIAPEVLANIFKPFSSSTRGTADEKGTSIGLMLTKQFVTENGGEIWIETELGEGSTFYFTVKAADNS